MEKHHFYHCFADGDWLAPVGDHFDALIRFGLIDELTSINIGFVGSRKNIALAKSVIDNYGYPYTDACRKMQGYEQETLEPLWKFTKEHDGLVSYAHTKGSANFAPINARWRRSMEFYNFCDWRRVVKALTEEGKSIAGCHWFESHIAGPNAVPGYGNGGMFGGNFWWTHCELLRQNCRPDRSTRHAAEHWLGQLSEVMPIIVAGNILDLNPGHIAPCNLHDSW